MGTLSKYNINNTGCDVFFETGTGTGNSLKHALDQGGFKSLYSSEIDLETAGLAQARFSKFSQVNILHLESIKALQNVLSLIELSQRVFFFLDAHFAGEVSGSFSGYEANSPDDINLPLENELRLIRALRPNCEDLIIVDDLRIYEDGPYANGNVSPGFANIPTELRNLMFIQEIFSERVVERVYKDEGYLLIKTRGSNFKLEELSTYYRTVRRLRRFLK